MLGGLLFAVAGLGGALLGAALGYALACLIVHRVLVALARRSYGKTATV